LDSVELDSIKEIGVKLDSVNPEGVEPDNVPPDVMRPESKPDVEGAGCKVAPFGAAGYLLSQVPKLTVSCANAPSDGSRHSTNAQSEYIVSWR
jgi:hypothetical protein